MNAHEIYTAQGQVVGIVLGGSSKPDAIRIFLEHFRTFPATELIADPIVMADRTAIILQARNRSVTIDRDSTDPKIIAAAKTAPPTIPDPWEQNDPRFEAADRPDVIIEP